MDFTFIVLLKTKFSNIQTKMTQTNSIGHHGILLKNYITQNEVNKKGGLNKFAESIGLTRQGVYHLYQQKELSKKHQETIIEYFSLPENFFPDITSEELKYNSYVMDLQAKLIESQQEVIDLERKVNNLTYRPGLQPVIVDANNQEKVALVPIKAAAGYTKNYQDPEYISQLQTFSFPGVRSGLAFEIEGDSMSPDINDKDYVICEELLEKIDDVKSKKPYVLVLRNGDIVCKLIEVGKKGLKLISINKEYNPYEVGLEEVVEIWGVWGRYCKLG